MERMVLISWRRGKSRSEVGECESLLEFVGGSLISLFYRFLTSVRRIKIRHTPLSIEQQSLTSNIER